MHASITSPGRWSRWTAVIVVLGAVLSMPLSGVVTFALQNPVVSGKVAPEGYERMQTGMRYTEASAAVGLPPGDYRDRAHRPGGRSFTAWSEEAATAESGGPSVDRLRWEGNEYSIAAGFDDAGTLTWKTLWRHVPPTPRGPADTLRRRLGW